MTAGLEKKLEEWKIVTKKWDIQGRSRALRERILDVAREEKDEPASQVFSERGVTGRWLHNSDW